MEPFYLLLKRLRQRRMLKDYLLRGKDATEAAELIQHHLGDNQIRMLNLSRDWLHSYLPFALSKVLLLVWWCVCWLVL